MQPGRRGSGRTIALALACALAACGGGEPAARRLIDPTPTSFSVTNLDLDRPCTLLTANDAADISGLPFYRTMAANLIAQSHIRCAQGVGAYGLHGVVEVDMQLAADGVSARDMFNRACRVMAGEPPQPPVPVIPPPSAFQDEGFGEARIDPAVLSAAPAPRAPTPMVNGDHCRLAGGAYALLLPDRLLFLRVRESAGEIDASATRRLASLVSFRLTSN
jgi:hypothetical protein